MTSEGGDLALRWLAQHESELIDVRRTLHAQPELGRQEWATTAIRSPPLAAATARWRS